MNNDKEYEELYKAQYKDAAATTQKYDFIDSMIPNKHQWKWKKTASPALQIRQCSVRIRTNLK